MKRMTNGHIVRTLPQERQHVISELQDDLLTGDNVNDRVPAKPRATKAVGRQNAPLAVDTLAIAELIHDHFSALNARLEAVENLLKEAAIRSAESGVAKEYYTTKEAAVILKRRLYTVREWCRLARVRARRLTAAAAWTTKGGYRTKNCCGFKTRDCCQWSGSWRFLRRNAWPNPGREWPVCQMVERAYAVMHPASV